MKTNFLDNVMNFKEIEKKLDKKCDDLIKEFPSKKFWIEAFRKDSIEKIEDMKKHFKDKAQDLKHYLNHNGMILLDILK